MWIGTFEMQDKKKIRLVDGWMDIILSLLSIKIDNTSLTVKCNVNKAWLDQTPFGEWDWLHVHVHGGILLLSFADWLLHCSPQVQKVPYEVTIYLIWLFLLEIYLFFFSINHVAEKFIISLAVHETKPQ